MILLFVDEGVLRERFPEIPWDQPVSLVLLAPDTAPRTWACRYCIALQGLRAQDVIDRTAVSVFAARAQALDHIEQVHHD